MISTLLAILAAAAPALAEVNITTYVGGDGTGCSGAIAPIRGPFTIPYFGDGPSDCTGGLKDNDATAANVQIQLIDNPVTGTGPGAFSIKLWSDPECTALIGEYGDGDTCAISPINGQNVVAFSVDCVYGQISPDDARCSGPK